jgi:hypothetical protein
VAIPLTARSVAWCLASIWSAPDGSGLLRLGASSIPWDREGTRRIVRMINGMISLDETAGGEADYPGRAFTATACLRVNPCLRQGISTELIY